MLRMDFTSQDSLAIQPQGLRSSEQPAPLWNCTSPIVGRAWITTTSDLAGRVPKDSETFRMRKNARVPVRASDARLATRVRRQHHADGLAGP